MNNRRDVVSLVDAIREFISLYQSVDNKMDSNGQITRLKALVDTLQGGP